MNFRGVTKEGKVVEGYYVKFLGVSYISQFPITSITTFKKNPVENMAFVEIHPLSLAMKVGIDDKNGVPIYGSIPVDGEMSRGGDKVERENPSKECQWLGVIWHECGFYYKCSCGRISKCPVKVKDVPIILGSQWEKTNES